MKLSTSFNSQRRLKLLYGCNKCKHTHTPNGFFHFIGNRKVEISNISIQKAVLVPDILLSYFLNHTVNVNM